MSSPEILARIERDHQNAVRLHQEASEKANAVTQRVDLIQARMAEISAARVAGTSTTDEAGELILLDGDLQVLKGMQASASEAVQAATTAMHAATVSHSNAEAAHAREQANLQFMALRQKTAEIETLFCKAIGATHAAGRALGHHSLGQSWKPCQDLHRAVAYNVAPPGA